MIGKRAGSSILAALLLAVLGAGCTERALAPVDPSLRAAQRCELADPSSERLLVAVALADHQMWALWSDGAEEAVPLPDVQFDAETSLVIAARGDRVLVADGAYPGTSYALFDLRAREALWRRTLNIPPFPFGGVIAADGRVYLAGYPGPERVDVTVDRDGVTTNLPGDFMWLTDDDTAVLERPRQGHEAADQPGWWHPGEEEITRAPLESGGQAAWGAGGAIVYPVHDAEHHRIAIARPEGTSDLAAPVAGNFDVVSLDQRFLKVDAVTVVDSVLLLDTANGMFSSRNRDPPWDYAAVGSVLVGVDQVTGEGLYGLTQDLFAGLYRWSSGTPALIGLQAPTMGTGMSFRHQADAVVLAFKRDDAPRSSLDEIVSLGSGAQYTLPIGTADSVVFDVPGACALYVHSPDEDGTVGALKLLRLRDGYSRTFGPARPTKDRRYTFVDVTQRLPN